MRYYCSTAGAPWARLRFNVQVLGSLQLGKSGPIHFDVDLPAAFVEIALAANIGAVVEQGTEARLGNRQPNCSPNHISMQVFCDAGEQKIDA